MGVGAGEFDDGPGAAESDALGPEYLEVAGDVGAEVVGGPGCGVGFGYDSRKLGGDVGLSGQLIDVMMPLVDEVITDAGFTEVIENEGRLRAVSGEGGEIGELGMEATKVYTQSSLSGGVRSGDVGMAVGMAPGTVLSVVADTFHEWTSGEGVEHVQRMIALVQRGGGDDAGKAGIGGREGLNPVHLVAPAVDIADALEEDDFFRRGDGGLGLVGGGSVWGRDRFERFEPAVGEDGAVPEVNVGIDVT